MSHHSQYPAVLDPARVGSYQAVVKAGGDYVWDAVLEYRVWCHPELGAPDEEDGSDYYYAFATYREAHEFSQGMKGADVPLALILQEEYIDEPTPGQYIHVKEPRMTEWPVEFLQRPKRSSNTIRDFMDPHAPPNRLDILWGLAT